MEGRREGGMVLSWCFTLCSHTRLTDSEHQKEDFDVHEHRVAKVVPIGLFNNARAKESGWVSASDAVAQKGGLFRTRAGTGTHPWYSSSSSPPDVRIMMKDRKRAMQTRGTASKAHQWARAKAGQ